MKKIVGTFLALSSLIFSTSDACTGLKLTSKDNKTIHGRTLEFGLKLDTSVVTIPKGYAFTATTPMGQGLSYQAKYNIIGCIGYEYISVLDGMNEAGLSVGTFYFPGYASYTPTTKENQSRSLSPVDFPNWILSQFGSLEEVKSAVPSVYIAPTVDKQWGDAPPPFHYIVYDKQGNSLVIEPLNGKLAVSDNPLGVFTNSPDFQWHQTNLRNFINLSPENPSSTKFGNLVLAPFGQGSGLVGLPGDFSPPSRFVRAALYSVKANPVNTVDEAVFQAFHLLNQFDIPLGAVRDEQNGTVHFDYTLATVVRDPHNLRYYFRTYEDQTIRRVDLKSADMSSKQIKKMSTSGRQTYRCYQ